MLLMMDGGDPMGTSGFQAALLRGEPLADFTVVFRVGVDAVSATERINALANDFDLFPKPWYDDPRLRAGSATRDALERMFGWRLRRSPGPGNNLGFMWEEVTRPTCYPPGLEALIERMGLTQPGRDDDGQWYEYKRGRD